MKIRRPTVLIAALIGSLVVNALSASVLMALVARKGGPRYVMEKLGLARTVKQFQPWQQDLVRRHRSLPNSDGEIVFLGDSITESVPWAEYFTEIRNRGIGGDTSDGVLQRLDETIESRPRQVFLNIGTNDLTQGLPVEEVLRNVEAIVGRIQAESPGTEVYLCSVLPINLDFERCVALEKKLEAIGVYDEGLRRLAEATGVHYIDLRPAFSDERGYLKAELTLGDGLHLNDLGASTYCKTLGPYLKSAPPRAGGNTLAASPADETTLRNK